MSGRGQKTTSAPRSQGNRQNTQQSAEQARKEKEDRLTEQQQKSFDADQQIAQHEERKKTSHTALNLSFSLRKGPGNQLEQIPDLSPQWCSNIDFMPYVPLLGERSYLTPTTSNMLRGDGNSADSSTLDQIDALPPTTVIEILGFYHDDLIKLLSMNHQLFWCHVLYRPSIMQFIDTFLRFCPRPFETTFEREELEAVFETKLRDSLGQVTHLVFLVLVRLSSNPEKDGFLTKEFYAETIFNKAIFDIPKIMDICAIYSKKNYEATRRLVCDVIRAQPTFVQSLVQSCQHIFRAFSVISNTFSPSSSALQINPAGSTPKQPAQDIDKTVCLDSIDYLLDITHTLASFLKVYHETVWIFEESGLFDMVAHIFELSLPKLQQTTKTIMKTLSSEIYTKIQLIQENLLTMANVSLQHYYFNYMSSTAAMHFHPMTKSPLDVRSIAARFLHTIRVMIESEKTEARRIQFLRCLDENHKFIHRCLNLQNKGLWIDEYQLEYILRILADLIQISPEDIHTIFDKRATGDSSAKTTTKATPTREMIQVQEVFPDIGFGFIRKLIEFYGNSIDQAIQALMEDNMPPHLANLPRDLEDGPAASSNQEPAKAVVSTTPKVASPQVTVVSIGKKTKHGKDADLFRGGQTALIRDLVYRQIKEEHELDGQSSRVEAEFLDIGVNAGDDEYDDEYDDAWDSYQVAAKDMGDETDDSSNEDRDEADRPTQPESDSMRARGGSGRGTASASGTGTVPTRQSNPRIHHSTAAGGNATRPGEQSHDSADTPKSGIALGTGAEQTNAVNSSASKPNHRNRNTHDPHRQKNRALNKQQRFGGGALFPSSST